MILRSHWTAGLAALLLAPAMGSDCGPDVPPPTPEFPEGQYFVSGLYAYYLDSPLGPVAYWVAYTWDGDSAPDGGFTTADGDYFGNFIGVVFEDAGAFQAGGDPACLVYESLEAVERPESALPFLDTDTCEFCQHYAQVTTNFISAEGEGCTDEILDAYYGGSEPQTWVTHWGYRHAADDGWPTELDDLAQALEDAGYVGSLYEEYDGEFFPSYGVTPTDLSARTRGLDAWEITSRPSPDAPIRSRGR